MTIDQYKKLAIVLAGGCVICLAFAVGVVVVNMRGGEPAPAGDNHVQLTKAGDGEQAGTATDPGPLPALPAAGAAGSFTGTQLKWDLLENGCTVKQEEAVFRIAGTSAQDGWDHWNGVRTAQAFIDGDFTAAADFKVPTMTGPGFGLIYLRVTAENGEAAGILFQPTSYQVQRWSPKSFSGSVRSFGDEATTYHRMKMEYEAQTHFVTGWIDDRQIGKIAVPLSGNLQFWMICNTERSGKQIEFYFRDFTLKAGPDRPAQLP